MGGDFSKEFPHALLSLVSPPPPPPPPHFPEAFSQREYGAGGKGQAIVETGTKKMLLPPLQPPAPGPLHAQSLVVCIKRRNDVTRYR